MHTMATKAQARSAKVRWGVLRWAGGLLAAAVLTVHAADPVTTPAGPEGPAQTAHLPAKVPAPVVVVLSGQTGPANYQFYAAEVARLGYYAVLLDGKDILTRTQDGAGNLKKAIQRAQGSPNATPGKVGVVAFSQGGGGALAHAVVLPELVSMVVAHYPATNWIQNMPGAVKRFQVPLLVLTGERDRYNNCCLIDSMRAMESAAKDTAAGFELVVYPQADHAFNLPNGPTFRKDDAADAWRRTSTMLEKYLPLPI